MKKSRPKLVSSAKLKKNVILCKVRVLTLHILRGCAPDTRCAERYTLSPATLPPTTWYGSLLKVASRRTQRTNNCITNLTKLLGRSVRPNSLHRSCTLCDQTHLDILTLYKLPTLFTVWWWWSESTLFGGRVIGSR